MKDFIAALFDDTADGEKRFEEAIGRLLLPGAIFGAIIGAGLGFGLGGLGGALLCTALGAGIGVAIIYVAPFLLKKLIFALATLLLVAVPVLIIVSLWGVGN